MKGESAEPVRQQDGWEGAGNAGVPQRSQADGHGGWWVRRNHVELGRPEGSVVGSRLRGWSDPGPQREGGGNDRASSRTCALGSVPKQEAMRQESETCGDLRCRELELRARAVCWVESGQWHGGA